MIIDEPSAGNLSPSQFSTMPGLGEPSIHLNSADPKPNVPQSFLSLVVKILQ